MVPLPVLQHIPGRNEFNARSIPLNTQLGVIYRRLYTCSSSPWVTMKSWRASFDSTSANFKRKTAPTTYSSLLLEWGRNPRRQNTLCL